MGVVIGIGLAVEILAQDGYETGVLMCHDGAESRTAL